MKAGSTGEAGQHAVTKHVPFDYPDAVTVITDNQTTAGEGARHESGVGSDIKQEIM